jgi:hypothetical protein
MFISSIHNLILISMCISVISSVAALSLKPVTFNRVRSILSMNVPGGMGTSPGRNLKPTFDGTFKEAGAPLEKYVLEHENGDRALVDTKTATCISWIHKGKERIASKASVHRFPTATTPLVGEFFPEERAKKVSFDRMIFKVEDAGDGIEYRCDVTMREDSLEYDITIINLSPNAKEVTQGLQFALNGAKVTSKKGFTEQTDNSVSTGKWTIPVGKFKETSFYVKISPV